MKGKVFLLILLSYIPAVQAQQPVQGYVDSNLVKTLFFAGLRDKLNEDYSRANESFTKILVLDPNNAAVHYEIAVMNYRQNKLFEAEMAIKKALVADGNNVWYWMLMAELYKRKGDMEALVEVLNQMIRLAPDKEAYYYDRSNAWLLAGNTDAAMKGYDELEKKFGNSEALNHARQRVTMEKDDTAGGQNEGHQAAASLSPEQTMLVLGEKLYRQGDLKGAMAQFKSILKNTDQIYMAWERAIHIEVVLGLYAEALKTADEALSLYPSQAVLYYHKAVALQHISNYTEALTNIETALQLDEGNALYMELYGDVLFLKGEPAQALLQWKKSKAAGNSSEKLNKKINERKYLE
ncbi:tetratricopeptide (TPR) repeat protein [Pedobacter sp. AK017]|uniref:tetratricopeptide repeat protein n=1 Tax=Pedobacter sp. AK017 TaxID=2723073 RepID=UPI00160851B4|nr:tetratricopeptide repeat protein [Pedobacter sp. AK017]MBB5438791.1 tetratricopeptide (TPR) repeat protein [Pedobacter sp. AK017]